MIIDFLEGKEKAVSTLKKFPKEDLATTFINRYELLKYKKYAAISEAVDNLFTYQSEDIALEASAQEYMKLKLRGITMSDNDLLIFGVCIANDEELITQDKAFKHIGSRLITII